MNILNATETEATVATAPTQFLARRHVPDADEVVEEVVSALKRISRDASLQVALDVGHLVVERLFAGDVERMRSRASKSVALRKLAAHPELPFSSTTLWRSIRIYELVKRMPGLVRHRHIGVAHLRSVLSLPPPAQELVLRDAVRFGWTVSQTQAAAAERRASGAGAERRTPRAASYWAKRVGRLNNDVAHLEEFRSAPEEQQTAILTALSRLQQLCATVLDGAEDDVGANEPSIPQAPEG